MSRKNKRNKMQTTPENKAIRQTPEVKPVAASPENKSDQPGRQVGELKIEINQKAFK